MNHRINKSNILLNEDDKGLWPDNVVMSELMRIATMNDNDEIGTILPDGIIRKSIIILSGSLTANDYMHSYFYTKNHTKTPAVSDNDVSMIDNASTSYDGILAYLFNDYCELNPCFTLSDLIRADDVYCEYILQIRMKYHLNHPILSIANMSSLGISVKDIFRTLECKYPIVNTIINSGHYDAFTMMTILDNVYNNKYSNANMKFFNESKTKILGLLKTDLYNPNAIRQWYHSDTTLFNNIINNTITVDESLVNNDGNRIIIPMNAYVSNKDLIINDDEEFILRSDAIRKQFAHDANLMYDNINVNNAIYLQSCLNVIMRTVSKGLSEADILEFSMNDYSDDIRVFTDFLRKYQDDGHDLTSELLDYPFEYMIENIKASLSV